MRIKNTKKHVYTSLPISGYDLTERLGYATGIKAITSEYFNNKEWRVMCPFDIAPYRDEYEYKDYMRDDLYVLYGSDAIVMCDNWLESKGCRDEFFIAVNQGITLYSVDYDENGRYIKKMTKEDIELCMEFACKKAICGCVNITNQSCEKN